MDAIMNFLGDFDPTAFLPNISFTFGLINLLARLSIFIVPASLLILGFFYFFKPVPEPNKKSGYRIFFIMKDPDAWTYVQRLAGFIYLVLGGVMMLAMIIVSLVLIGKGTMTLLTTVAICLVIDAVLIIAAVVTITVLAVIRHRNNIQNDRRRPAPRKK